MSVDVIAAGAVSPLGEGEAAYDPGVPGEPAPTRVRKLAELERAGLRKPFAAPVEVPLDAGDADRAGHLLELATRLLVRELDEVLPAWRERRVGVVLGTSGGGMPSLVECAAIADRGGALDAELARRAPYFGPLRRLELALGVRPSACVQVLVACASSTFALGLGASWLELGYADLVLAGGYDALCPFIAAGFECLGATGERPRPFRRVREGLALGEGAALLALGRSEPGVASRGRLLGFGASSDAVHITAPDRTGAGLVRAARRALAEAETEPAEVGLVSAHGTGTAFNDAAESKAVAAVLGEHAPQAVIQPFKGVIGHTLGAAGALESLSALSAMSRGVLPAAHGEGEREPELTARLLDRAEPGAAERCLKLSSAFGGANVSLVLGSASREPGPPARRTRAREVHVLGVGEPVTAADPSRLAGRVATGAVQLGRMDPVSLLCVCAGADLASRLALPAAAGVIVGTASATLEIDADFERRRMSRGPEPRRFPATSPNLAAGECSIAFGLVGPSLSAGASPAAAIEALLVAHDLVASGHADVMLVISAEHVGDFTRTVFASAGWPLPAPGAVAVVVGAGGPGPRLERDAVLGALAASEVAGGGLAEARPGWPSLLGLLEAAGCRQAGAIRLPG